MAKEISCGIIPLYKNEEGNYEVLLIQHKKGRHRGFPKGGIKEKESNMQTAQRECKEETGLEFHYIDQKKFTEQYAFMRDGEQVDKYVYYFVGLTNNNVITMDPREIKAAARFPLEEAHARLTFYATRKLRAKVVNYLTDK